MRGEEQLLKENFTQTNHLHTHCENVYNSA